MRPPWKEISRVQDTSEQELRFHLCRVCEKKRPQQKGHPATQAAFSSRENSSNGGKFRQNFMAESYEWKKPCVNKYLGNKYLYFQQLTKKINMARKFPISRQNTCGSQLTSLD
jgi:hypothetical protein